MERILEFFLLNGMNLMAIFWLPQKQFCEHDHVDGRFIPVLSPHFPSLSAERSRDVTCQSDRKCGWYRFPTCLVLGLYPTSNTISLRNNHGCKQSLFSMVNFPCSINRIGFFLKNKHPYDGLL